MNSLQQVVMGLTCLAAAFLFGRYIHNRPATIEQGPQAQTSDPLESFLAGRSAQTPVQVAQSLGPSQHIASAAVVTDDHPAISGANAAPAKPQLQLPQTKSVAPDFSELAARFRNSPLELGHNINSQQGEPAEAKLPNATPPQLVIRQPDQTVSIRRMIDQRERFEQPRAGRSTASTESWTNERFPERTRQSADTFSSAKGQWRVNRPEYDSDQQRSIDDIYQQRTADYLRDENTVFNTELRDGAATQSVTSVTEPPLPAAPYQAQFAEPAQFASPAQFVEPGGFSEPVSARYNPQSVTAPSFAELRRSLDQNDPGVRFSKGNRQTNAQQTSNFDSAWQPPPVPRPEPDTEPTQRWNTNTQDRSNFVPPQERQRLQRQQRTYRVQPGDRLQTISQQFYGTPDRYIELYKANRQILDGITNIPGGVEIVIPELE